MIDNAYGKHSFDDLDESWYRYMKADREERKQMCEDMLETEALVNGVAVVVFIVVGIVLLCKGII